MKRERAHNSRPMRLHPRLSRPDVRVDSPLMDCRLVDLSTSGLAVETSVGLRLGVPYPFRLDDGQQVVNTEARVCWCRLVRTETVDGESRPVFRAGAAFVDWQAPSPESPPEPAAPPVEAEIDATIDAWIERSWKLRDAGEERTVVHRGSRPPWG